MDVTSMVTILTAYLAAVAVAVTAMILVVMIHGVPTESTLMATLVLQPHQPDIFS